MEYLFVRITPDLPIPKNDYPAKVTRTLNQMVAEGWRVFAVNENDLTVSVTFERD